MILSSEWSNILIITLSRTGINFIWQKRILGKLKYPFLMTINEMVEYTQHGFQIHY